MRRAGYTTLIGLVVVSMVFLSGCAIFSSQQFGAMQAKYGSIQTGVSEAEVLLQYGIPDIVYKGANCKALVYVTGSGMTVAGGIYTRAARNDMVVVLDSENKVISVQEVDRGYGQTVIGPPETMPLPSVGFPPGCATSPGCLFSGPNNYSTEQE